MERTLVYEGERGQSMMLVALLLPIIALFLWLLVDYAVATERVQQVTAAADLGTHAGVQEVDILPDGSLKPSRKAIEVVQAYFWRNIPPQIRPDVSVSGVSCGMAQHPRAGKVPYCRIEAHVRVGGNGLPAKEASVISIAYLPYGATREGQ